MWTIGRTKDVEPRTRNRTWGTFKETGGTLAGPIVCSCLAVTSSALPPPSRRMPVITRHSQTHKRSGLRRPECSEVLKCEIASRG
jgi:hypothetical protein